MNIKAWIHASRLRTLPLAAAGIILGSLIAASAEAFRWDVFLLALLTTLLLQILSNWANDYGDFSHGVDNENRVGPQRTLQSGAILPTVMKKAMIGLGISAFISGITLLYLSLGHLFNLVFVIFLVLGLLAIAASIKYTVGKSNYGYKGFGDIMVFVFFGLSAILGTYYLHTNTFGNLVYLPAISIGLLSSAVLNLNNMRDIENDKNSGKITMAVKLGSKRSKIYHLTIIITALLVLDLYLSITGKKWQALSLLLPSIPFIIHCIKVWYNSNPADLDPELKRLSLSTLLISIWTGFAVLY